MLDNQQPGAGRELRLPVAAGIAVAILVARGRQVLATFRVPTRDPRCAPTSAIWMPQTLEPQTSLYRDNAHIATALFNFKLPRVQGIAPEAHRRRIVLHFLGQPPDQLLSAAGDTLAADQQKDQPGSRSGDTTDMARLSTCMRASARTW